MKHTVLFLFALLLLCSVTACSEKEKKPEKILRHVVFFGFTEETTPEQVKEIENAFCKLPSQIKEIKGYEWGTDCSPEGLQQGHTHCFFLTFYSEKERDAYLIDPAHKAFGKLLGNKLKAVTVVDYWVQ